VNVSVAMVIGLTILNVFQPGRTWQGHIEEISRSVSGPTMTVKKSDDPEAPGATLELLPNVAYYVPSSLIRPFVYNNIISVVLMALLIGAAMRRVRREEAETGERSMTAVIAVIEGGYKVLAKMLEWVVLTVPFAVFGVIAGVVGQAGLGVFRP